jgi:hypothetical protein
MSALKRRLARLRGFNAAVRQGDPKIAEESADLNGLETLEVLQQDIGLESIIMRRQRPVLAIRNNETQLVFEDPGAGFTFQIGSNGPIRASVELRRCQSARSRRAAVSASASLPASIPWPAVTKGSETGHGCRSVRSSRSDSSTERQ